MNNTLIAAPAAPACDNVVSKSITSPAITQQQVQHKNKTKCNRKNRTKAITIAYLNDMPFGALEKVLADIYAAKIRNGSLDICDI